MPEKRIIWIDIFKGIMILLVVIGHTSSPFNGYIYSFHMPAFFFISGYTTNFYKDEFREFFVKKTLALMIPFFIISLIFLLARYLMHVANIESIFFPDQTNISMLLIKIRDLFVFLKPESLAGASWFLVTLFLGSLLSKIAFNLFSYINERKSKYLIVIFAILCFKLAYYLFSKKLRLPLNLDLALLAVFYIILGFMVKNLIYRFKNYNIKILALAFLAPALYTVHYYVNIEWARMNWPPREFGPSLGNVLASISGILIVSMISILISKIKLITKLFSHIGQRSLQILFFHFLSFRILFYMFHLFEMGSKEQLLQVVQIEHHQRWYIYACFSILFSLVLDKIISYNPRIYKILFGKLKFSLNPSIKLGHNA